MAERDHSGTPRSSTSSLDVNPPVDVRVAQLNDVYNAGWVVCAAFNVLNTKHGYTEVMLEPTRGGKDKHIEHIARKLAIGVKHKNKVLYVATAPVATSSPRTPTRKNSSLVQQRKLSGATTIDITLPEMRKSLSNAFPPSSTSPVNSPKIILSTSPRGRSLSSRGESGMSLSSPFKRGRGLSINSRPHGSSFSFDRTRRRPSFTPLVAIEGKQGQHKQKCVGVVILDKRDAVFGLGPLAVHPHFSGQGFGRQLLQTVIEDWHDCKSDTYGQSIRLTVEAYNATALSLFVKMGCQIRENFICMKGIINIQILPKNYTITPLIKAKVGQAELLEQQTELLEQCGKVMDTVFGYRRMNELKEAIDDPACYPFVILKKKGTKIHVVGYTSTLGVSGHSCALNMEDLQALIIGVSLYYNLNHEEEPLQPIGEKDAVQKPKELVKPNLEKRISSVEKSQKPPTEISFLIAGQSQPELLAWCLNGGLLVVKQTTLLSLGHYEAPSPPHYFPSILY